MAGVGLKNCLEGILEPDVAGLPSPVAFLFFAFSTDHLSPSIAIDNASL